jgi:hypothetical protein
VSIFIFDVDALEKMAVVEEALQELAPSVASWLEEQRTDTEGPCTFLVYRNEWEKTWRPRLGVWSPESLKRDHVRDPKHGDSSIYGVGGWHRYYVAGDGEIVFIAAFAAPHAVRLAETTGFKIHR